MHEGHEGLLVSQADALGDSIAIQPLRIALLPVNVLLPQADLLCLREPSQPCTTEAVTLKALGPFRVRAAKLRGLENLVRRHERECEVTIDFIPTV